MDRALLFKRLNLYYKLVFAVVFLVAVKGFFLVRYGFSIDAKSTLGIGLGSFSMICLLVSVPLVLKYFSNKTKQLHLLTNEEEKIAAYHRCSSIRLIVVGFNFSLNILFFYLMHTNSFLFAAGIAAIALYFCKPNERKIENDILDKEEDDDGDDLIDNQDKE